MTFNQSGMRIRLMLALLALAFLLFNSLTAFAQRPLLPDEAPTMPKPSPTPAPPPKDEDYEVVRVTSNLVVVPVSVTDAAGQPVLGLKVPDFRLEEEGRAQNRRVEVKILVNRGLQQNVPVIATPSSSTGMTTPE